MVITLLFNQAYSNAEIEYYLVCRWVWVWLAILAAEVAALAVRRIAGGAAAPAVRRVEMAAAAIVAIVLLLPSIAEMDARRDQADRSDDVHAQAWLDQTLPVLEPNAVIVVWSTSTPLVPSGVIGERPTSSSSTTGRCST